ncbi:MAG: aminotransferase class I/II-fold pyridoxal phosphate-dependent enzyme [Gemmatimonadota bacterium]
MIGPSARLRALPGYPLADVPTIKRRLQEAGVDVIDLGAGDNDTPPPPVVVEALQRAVENPVLSKYGFQQGLPAFRQAIGRYLERRFGLTVDPVSELLPLIGSKEGLAHLPLAFLDPGDVAIIPEPGYQAYLGGARLAGAEPHVVPLTADRGFLLELTALPDEILRRARVVFLNYPNNPTAAVATPEYLARTVEICQRYQILLAYDNAYCDLTFDGYVAPSIFQTPGAREVAVEFFSLSKSYSMTGWRLGWAVARPELIAAMTKAKSYLDTGSFLALQQAAAVALDQSEALVAPICASLRARRDACVAALAGVGFVVEAPKAAMYLWVPLPGGIPSSEFARRALEAEGVVVLPGRGFGPAGEGYFRIALTAEPDRLEEAVARLGRVWAHWEERELAGRA